MAKPTAKPAPDRDGSSCCRPLGAIHDDAPPVFVREAALRRILDYSEQDMTREVGGFLVGGLYEDSGRYVEVRHFLAAAAERSRAASLAFTHNTWSTATREIQQQFPGDRIVGWHHTHPRLGVFLSTHDLFIHRHFFRETWQVALVVDPCRREFGFFQWRGGRVVDCGFIWVRTADSTDPGAGSHGGRNAAG